MKSAVDYCAFFYKKPRIEANPGFLNLRLIYYYPHFEEPQERQVRQPSW